MRHPIHSHFSLYPARGLHSDIDATGWSLLYVEAQANHGGWCNPRESPKRNLSRLCRIPPSSTSESYAPIRISSEGHRCPNTTGRSASAPALMVVGGSLRCKIETTRATKILTVITADTSVKSRGAAAHILLYFIGSVICRQCSHRLIA